MLVRFLAKRVAVMAAAAAAFAFIIDGFNPAVPLGILLGGFLALCKTRLNQRAIAAAATGGSAVKSGGAQLLAQLFTLGFLAVAAYANTRLFTGAAIGLLLLPVFICANAATERLRLTRNAWGEGATPAEGRQPWKAP